MIIAEVSIVPLGTEETTVSKYVKKAVEELENSDVKVTRGPMGTVLEAESLDEILDAVSRAHQAVLDMGAERILTDIKIDDRRDKEATAEKKLKAIK